MRKWFYLPAAIWLMSFSISMRAQGSPRKDIKSDTSKVLTARNNTPAPSKPVTEDPGNYSIGPGRRPHHRRLEGAGNLAAPSRCADDKRSLPLLNDVQAAGLTPTQLSAEIEEKLHESIIKPQVTVIVTQMSSQRIYILGQVTLGGAYPLLPD